MERNLIIKALECCLEPVRRCGQCQYVFLCENLYTDIISLINELTVELDAMRGAANSYKMHNEKLTEENERLKAQKEVLEITEKDLRFKNKELQKCNESLAKNIEELEIEGDKVREAYSFYEETTGLKKVRADTVRKMQERLKTCFEDNTKYDGFRISVWIDRIANEVMEGNDDK